MEERSKVLAELYARRNDLTRQLHDLNIAISVLGGTAHDGHNGNGHGTPPAPDDDPPSRHGREFKRVRYVSTLPPNADPSTLNLSPQRRAVDTVIHKAGPKGILAREIVKRSGLPHGSVQQAARWLANQGLVLRQEDDSDA